MNYELLSYSSLTIQAEALDQHCHIIQNLCATCVCATCVCAQGLDDLLREVYQRSSLDKQKQLRWILEQLLDQQPADDTEDSGDEGNETDMDAEV